MSFILIATYKLGLSDFKHIAIDGTIKQAYNSPFNIIKEKDNRLLIKHYMVELLTKDEIKKLRKTAQKFLKDKQKRTKKKQIFILNGGVCWIFPAKSLWP